VNPSRRTYKSVSHLHLPLVPSKTPSALRCVALRRAISSNRGKGHTNPIHTRPSYRPAFFACAAVPPIPPASPFASLVLCSTCLACSLPATAVVRERAYLRPRLPCFLSVLSTTPSNSVSSSLPLPFFFFGYRARDRSDPLRPQSLLHRRSWPCKETARPWASNR
jgi:hypothetical protein